VASAQVPAQARPGDRGLGPEDPEASQAMNDISELADAQKNGHSED